MREITMQDVRELREKFENYTKTAEQHEFPMLLFADIKFQNTIDEYMQNGITDQADANAMFRVILRLIGEDFSEYMPKGE